MKNVGKKLSSNKGFTIIEVVLVLAIAGLIFLIVFLAVPALQSSRRDTQRRSDIGRFMGQLESSASNRNGNYPGTAAEMNTFVNGYMDDFRDPNGNNYIVGISTTAPTAEGNISYSRGRACNADNTGFVADAGDRNVAAMIFLENGGAYCQDNQ